MKTTGKLCALLLCLSISCLSIAQNKDKEITLNVKGIWNVSMDMDEFRASVDSIIQKHENSNLSGKRANTDPEFYDVVVEGATLVSNGPFADDGFNLLPGAPFVVFGWIYPGFTLINMGPSEIGDFPYGVNEDGSPEFPELVIGRWACYGWAHFKSLTTQIFDLDVNDDSPGNQIILTHGMEPYSAAGMTRAVIGGTGDYNYYRGETFSIVLTAGTNASGGLNFIHVFEPRTRIFIKN